MEETKTIKEKTIELIDVLPFVIRDIFGNEYGQFEQNKEKFWGLFYFYKEKIMEDIDAMKVELPL